LEDRGLLDSLNDIHLFALHYVYLPRVNKTLEGFVQGWNNHNIRTAGHMSPHQLFVEGALRLQNSGLTALDFSEHVDEAYGVDHSDPLHVLQDDEGIEIPQSSFVFQEDHYEALQDLVDPQAQSNSYGIDYYQITLDFVYEKIGKTHRFMVNWRNQLTE
jgi:hypothetical protein